MRNAAVVVIEALEAEGCTVNEALDAIPLLATAEPSALTNLGVVRGMRRQRGEWFAAALVPCPACPGRSC